MNPSEILQPETTIAGGEIMVWWSLNPCWDSDYDGESEPEGERQILTRLGETAADALSGKPQEEWNRGTHGDCEADYSQEEHDRANAFGDVQRYYDQCNSADIDIQIKRGNDD